MSVSALAEGTIASELRRMLEENGLRVDALPKMATPSGLRNPDLVCDFGREKYVIAIKCDRKQVFEAISRIQNDYMKHAKSIGIRGGFAVLPPPELSNVVKEDDLKAQIAACAFSLVSIFPPEDERVLSRKIGKLHEIAECIYESVTKPPALEEISVPFVIDVLRDATSYLVPGIKTLTRDQITQFFGGEGVFDNILQFEKGTVPIEDLRLVTMYLLINQLLFYHVLSKNRTDVAEIDEGALVKPGDLGVYFDHIIKNVEFQPVFSYNIVPFLPSDGIDPIRQVIRVIKGIAPEKIRAEFLGTIFHDLIPYDLRKKVAAFYTNPLAAGLLATLAIDDEKSSVVDLACGSGGLLVAAYNRKRDLLLKKGKFLQSHHDQFMADDIVGIDVMPFATSIAASQLSLQSPRLKTSKLQMGVWDATDLRPGNEIPAVARTTSRPGETEKIALKKVDLVIMNPPFTRQERLGAGYKALLDQRFAEYAKYLAGQMSYFNFFIFLADKFLEIGGRIAFVLPSSFLRAKSSLKIRSFLADWYHVEFLITGRKQLNFSDSTWKREFLLIAKKIGPSGKDPPEKVEDLFTKVIGIESLPANRTECDQLCHEVKSLNNDQVTKVFTAIRVNSSELRANLDWYRFFSSIGASNLDSIFGQIRQKGGSKIAAFGESVPDFLRGIETRSAVSIPMQFMALIKSPDDLARRSYEWEIVKESEDSIDVQNRFNGSQASIPIGALLPFRRTISNKPQMNALIDPDYVVSEDWTHSSAFFYGSNAKYRGLIRNWTRYVKGRLGNLMVARRFTINTPGTIHLAYYGDKPFVSSGTTWICNLPPDSSKIICLWLNSSLNVAQVLARRLEDIWIDLHAYNLIAFSIINPDALSARERKKITDMYDAIQNDVFPSLLDQYTGTVPIKKKEIDKLLLEMMGFKDPELSSLLTQLYAGLKEEFDTLNQMDTDTTRNKKKVSPSEGIGTQPRPAKGRSQAS